MALQIIKSIREMQDLSEGFRLQRKKIAVVPTMGYLHAGHTSLISRARNLADIVITTIFVNPTQFAPNEDYNRYPRDFERDRQAASDAGTDIIFYPTEDEMYPKGFDTFVQVEKTSKMFEGEFRPTHFRGVTTIVMKLLHITKPHIAIFGQKDAQQVFIVQKMVRDLNMDIQIIVAPIVREPDGLAMSSRNAYLNPSERQRAVVLSKSLKHAQERIGKGEKNIDTLHREILGILESGSPTQIDYVAFINPETFEEVQTLTLSTVLIAFAVHFESTRLIDNSIISIP